jgi:iron-sulfur cluster assembly protein
MNPGVYRSGVCDVPFRGGRYNPLMITLAPAALERVRGFLAETPEAIGLRFGVRRTGCSGWGYAVDLARDEREGDTMFEHDGVRIYVDDDSLALVDGTEIDFLKNGLSEQFVFRNPNVAGECGCGESFTTDAERAA